MKAQDSCRLPAAAQLSLSCFHGTVLTCSAPLLCLGTNALQASESIQFIYFKSHYTNMLWIQNSSNKVHKSLMKDLMQIVPVKTSATFSWDVALHFRHNQVKTGANCTCGCFCAWISLERSALWIRPWDAADYSDKWHAIWCAILINFSFFSCSLRTAFKKKSLWHLV